MSRHDAAQGRWPATPLSGFESLPPSQLSRAHVRVATSQ
jgi:hypothetical protein